MLHEEAAAERQRAARRRIAQRRIAGLPAEKDDKVWTSGEVAVGVDEGGEEERHADALADPTKEREERVDSEGRAGLHRGAALRGDCERPCEIAAGAV